MILEEKFDNLTKYIEPDEKNYEVFSLELVNQLQAICSEMDVIMKEICGISQTERKNITDYCKVIMEKYPNITSYEARCYDLNCKPFDGWCQDQPAESLFWWKTYNNIKHGRVTNFRDANFKAVLYALAALCLLELLYLKSITDGKNILDRPDHESKIFRFPQIKYKYTAIGGGVVLKIGTNTNDDIEVGD